MGVSLLRLLPSRNEGAGRGSVWYRGVALTVALVVTAGCGVVSEMALPTTPAEPAAAPTTAAKAEPTVSAAAAPTVAASAPAPAKPDGPSFLDFISGAKTAAYKVTYKVSGAAGGQGMTGEQTWYVKPPRMRMDITLDGLGEAGTSTMLVLEDGSYLCTSLGSSQQCFKLPTEAVEQQNPAAAVQAQLQAQSEQVEAVRQESREIAGQQAQCFLIQHKGAPEAIFTEATTCYTAEGVPLLLQTKGASMEIAMEATSFSSSVADADFELPAPAVDFPAAPQGMPKDLPVGQPAAKP